MIAAHIFNKNAQQVAKKARKRTQHWAGLATHRGDDNYNAVEHAATHRVVPPGYGWLSSGVRIHGVDDRLPLPFLVNLTKTAAGLSVRSLPLKVLLIFIHIVHLELTGRKEVTGRGEWLSPSAFPPISKPSILQKETHIPKAPPCITPAPIPSLPVPPVA